MLPEPLLSHHLLDNFVSCLAIEKDEDLLIAELDVLLHQLPCRDYSLVKKKKLRIFLKKKYLFLRLNSWDLLPIISILLLLLPKYLVH